MNLPKLYRVVYVKCGGQQDDDGYFNATEYIKARLSLDYDNNMFWQVINEFNNILEYEFSDMDIYDLDLEWSNVNQNEVNRVFGNKQNAHIFSRNRWTIEYRKYHSEIPF